VGTQLRMLLAQPPDPDDAHNALRCIPYGLNVPAEMWHRFEHRFGAPLINIYGMTEALGPAVTSPLFGDRRVPSIGRIGLDREVMIADPDGSPVPTGEIGEILIKGVPGRSLLVQYYGKPEVTAAALRDGWLHTGDMGRADADGYLYFVDRLKDMIKSSGENVSAAEVEAAISRLDGVRDVAVVGRPDPVRDEAVVAFVIADAGSVTPDSVTAHCREHLARFKVPADVRLVDELPRTSIGKIEKRTLRALLERD
jgi:crotonobetaine/carnitine-CoA ligase